MEETKPVKKARGKGFVWHLRWLLPLVLALLIAGGTGTWFFGFHRPYVLAENTMPQNGAMTLERQGDGTALLSWSTGWNTDYYLVELTSGRDGQMPVFSAKVTAQSCAIPELPEGEMTLRVQSAKEYHTLWDSRIRMGTDALEFSGSILVPTVENIHYTADPEEKRLDIRYDLTEGASVRVLMAKDGEDEVWARVLDGENTVYTFGEGGEYPVPSFGETYTFSFQPYIRLPGLTFYGLAQEAFSVEREDFLGTVLNVRLEELGNNQYFLNWNETKGEHYEVQLRTAEEDDWQTLATVPQDGQRVYTTGHLERYTDYQFRVVAVGGQTLPGSEFAAVSEEMAERTGASLIYATVWPIQTLDVYSDADRTEIIGSAPEASAYCVLAEENGLFRVRFGDGYGYIDSNYCMINLPEYLGDLCSYDITNSYDALYKVHGYEIPNITGEVVKGYEDVDLGEDGYLVPLLYPTAKKLEQAALSALEQGVRIKIYDSYRPQEASLWVYNYTARILNDPIPETTYQGTGPAEDLPEPPAPAQPQEPAEGESPTEGQEPVEMTYQYLMTENGRYYLGNFITDTDSQHNLGIAMDMTLEWAESGWELEMQTEMHDLSFYSALEKNNSNANWLSSIMHGAGFGGLFSEWWHFQDNDTRNELGLKNYMKVGISPECWMADDNGWRYRLADGSYYTDCTVTMGEMEYTFDEAGYVTAQSPAPSAPEPPQ